MLTKKVLSARRIQGGNVAAVCVLKSCSIPKLCLTTWKKSDARTAMVNRNQARTGPSDQLSWRLSRPNRLMRKNSVNNDTGTTK